MEAGLSSSTEEAEEEVMDTTPTKREVDTAEAAVTAAVAVDTVAEVATVDMAATIITEVVDTEAATISFSRDNTTIIIIIVMRMEIKRKMPAVEVEEILINRNLLMAITKPNGLSMDRKRNQRSHLQRRKRLAQKKNNRMPPKYIKV
jgi:hypothetical protein